MRTLKLINRPGCSLRSFVISGLACALITACSASGPAVQVAGTVPSDAQNGDNSTAASSPIDLNISSVRLTGEVGAPYFTQRASDGGVLVLVSYDVTNKSDQPAPASDMPTLHLVDPKDVQYNVDDGKMTALNLAQHSDVKEFSDLNPGITVHNTAVFEVSKADFDPHTWSIVADGGDAKITVADVMAAAAKHARRHGADAVSG